MKDVVLNATTIQCMDLIGSHDDETRSIVWQLLDYTSEPIEGYETLRYTLRGMVIICAESQQTDNIYVKASKTVVELEHIWEKAAIQLATLSGDDYDTALEEMNASMIEVLDYAAYQDNYHH